MPWGKANVGYSTKDAKYLTNWLMIRRQQKLPKLKFARRDAAVQPCRKVTWLNRNQLARREIHKTVHTAEKSGWFVDLSKRLTSNSVLSSQLLLQVSAWKISAEHLHWPKWIPNLRVSVILLWRLRSKLLHVAALARILFYRSPYFKPCCVPFSELHQFNFAHL